MWYSNCEYLKLMKGEEYIAQCLAKKENSSEMSEQPQDVGPSSSPQPSTSGVASAATTSLPTNVMRIYLM